LELGVDRGDGFPFNMGIIGTLQWGECIHANAAMAAKPSTFQA